MKAAAIEDPDDAAEQKKYHTAPCVETDLFAWSVVCDATPVIPQLGGPDSHSICGPFGDCQSL
jgi:hypothetical protein